MSSFKEISATDLNFNVFKTISDWGLITAGDRNSYNTMTASWGAAGVMWNKNVVFAFIRPQRYTFEIIEKTDLFTFSFFKPEYNGALSICGSKSGRDCDKIKEAKLTPAFSEDGVYFDEADTVFLCKKLHEQFLDPAGFIDKSLQQNYANHDYHKMFVGEIVKVLVK